MMDTRTGNWVDAHDEAEALAKLQELDAATRAEDVVMIRGELRAVEEMGQRIRLGAAEQERRKARRKSQRASRRAHR